jgi:hypothetical protein
MPDDHTWAVARRLESLAGEARVNLFRLLFLVAFYGHHLANVYLFGDESAGARQYHGNVTALALAWGLAVLVVHLCLLYRWLPPALKFVATAWDLILITAVLMLGRDAPSTLAALYFLVIIAAGLRLSLPLVWFAGLGAMTAYAAYLAFLRYGAELPADKRLPRPQQIIFLLALGAAALLAGQFVRQCRRVAAGYPVTVVEEPSKPV